METLAEYIEEGGPHFIPLERIPVVDPGTSINESLRRMSVHGTQGLLVRREEDQYSLLLGERLSWDKISHLGNDPTQVYIADILEVASSVNTIEESQTREYATRVFLGDHPYRSVGVVKGGKVVGLFTEAEDFRSRFFSAATIYVCELKKHYYYPPPPGKCTVDGTSLSPLS